MPRRPAPPAAAAYRDLAAAERLEFRVPAALKMHLHEAAERAGLSASEYIVSTLAEQVARDLAGTCEWTLTVPEQEALLHAMASPRQPTRAARQAARRAEAVFGGSGKAKKKR